MFADKLSIERQFELMLIVSIIREGCLLISEVVGTKYLEKCL